MTKPQVVGGTAGFLASEGYGRGTRGTAGTKPAGRGGYAQLHAIHANHLHVFPPSFKEGETCVEVVRIKEIE